MDSLVEAAKRGDREAIEKLISRHEVEVRIYAARLAPTPDLGDDVAQNAFLEALENLDRFEAGRDFGLWVRGIVRNLARREWRRMARSKNAAAELAQHIQLLAEGAEGEMYEERLTALQKCMEQVPEKSNQLLRMFYEIGLKYSDIAVQAHASLDAVKKAMSRLRDRLRECVEKQMAGRPGM